MADTIKFKPTGAPALTNQYVRVTEATAAPRTVIYEADTLTTDAEGYVTIDLTGLASVGDSVIVDGDSYPSDAEYFKGFKGYAVVEGALLGYRVLLIGDSTTYGRGANPDGTAGVEGAHVDSPCRQLSRKLTALGVDADSHSVVGMGNNSSADSTELYYNETPDVSVDLGDWDSLETESIGGDLYRGSNVGDTITFTFGNVDKGALGIPVRTYGLLQYRVDGGSWTSFSQHRDDHEGVDDLARIELDFLTVGTHTVEIEVLETTGYICYCEAWDSSSQVVVVPWGARGYTSTDLNDVTRPWSYMSALDYVPFDAVVLNIGINDIRSGGADTDQSTYESNVTNYFNAIKAANPNAVIFMQIPNDISTGLSYLPTSITSLASSLGGILMDTRNAVDMSTYAIADAAGNMDDTLHPTDTGYSSQYDEFTPIIKSDIGA